MFNLQRSFAALFFFSTATSKLAINYFLNIKGRAYSSSVVFPWTSVLVIIRRLAVVVFVCVKNSFLFTCCLCICVCVESLQMVQWIREDILFLITCNFFFIVHVYICVIYIKLSEIAQKKIKVFLLINKIKQLLFIVFLYSSYH